MLVSMSMLMLPMSRPPKREGFAALYHDPLTADPNIYIYKLDNPYRSSRVSAMYPSLPILVHIPSLLCYDWKTSWLLATSGRATPVVA